MGILASIFGQKKQSDDQSVVDALSRTNAVVEFDTDAKILSANRNFLNLLNYDSEELIGAGHTKLISDNQTGQPQYTGLWTRFKQGESVAGEFEYQDSLGNSVWVQASYNPVLTTAGELSKVILIAHDITEQKQQNANFSGQISAINKSQAVIEFNLVGEILTANDNFLKTMSYSLNEIKGQHHSLFVDKDYANSAEYKAFWQRLNHGEFISGEFKRIDKNGDDIWIQATYNPIFDIQGRPYKVVKFASEVTDQKLQWADLSGQIDAIHKSQAVIEFDLNGYILAANDNFLKTLGYELAEVKGKHHALFVEQHLVESDEYQKFWTDLKQGKFKAGEFKRIGKSGESVWIQASYNPIFDMNGKPFKVVKYATDITAQKLAEIENIQIANLSNALKICQANVMIADNDLNIVYINEQNMKMLKRRENEIQKVLPAFNTQNLIGECIDIFHKEPSHQRRVLANLTEPYFANIKVGNLHFDLIATPWISPQGQRLGTIVEWEDRTEEVFIENEIDQLIQRAADGDLSARLDVNGKKGFVLNLSKGLNELVGIADGVIKDTVSMLDAMAHGNLTQRIEGDYSGNFAKLKDDANATVTKLTEIIARINQAATTVAAGADEIAQGNADLSQRTEEQASSLEETASSMEEMTSTVKQNADNAAVANQLASDARIKATEGGAVVKRAVSGMAEINDASKKIADIIGVIDEIAFQTNLLALNAAVEAARAGEQGRGFAVVAGEVRNLAQRSAEAAKEIKNLIRDSVAKVEDGSALVNESGETLSEIVAAVEKVSQMIADISVASKEQSSGIEQVNKAITQMDEMTQQNAALVEQASAAGESMSEQARAMKQLLSFFTVESGADSRHIEAISAIPKTNKTTQYQTKPSQTTTQKTSPAALSFNDDEDWEEF
ncbi:methyl-accepting chemotaxis protein [Catenovulum sp. 2E275]|uniref:methyl-accepting chemotaxis protein n=1 Tax=Catenovulum sp. 2E275 TaxID=2980497 RepID=UPI0021CEBCDE|nr:methyl-accepting chemotaxis protein [Catenovulum sp. 2E275]MCU4674422.1 methyl-accepting chemotaxis protein [Catenovulum sp. 2E275]